MQLHGLNRKATPQKVFFLVLQTVLFWPGTVSLAQSFVISFNKKNQNKTKTHILGHMVYIVHTQFQQNLRICHFQLLLTPPCSWSLIIERVTCLQMKVTTDYVHVYQLVITLCLQLSLSLSSMRDLAPPQASLPSQRVKASGISGTLIVLRCKNSW